MLFISSEMINMCGVYLSENQVGFALDGYWVVVT
jgi:hypothetical protein